MRKSILIVLSICLAAAVLDGCSTGPKAPSPSEAATEATQAKATFQKNVDAIQSNPNISPEQKAQIIAHLNQPQPVQAH